MTVTLKDLVVGSAGGGGEETTSAWEDIAWRALGESAAALTDRLNMSDGFVEPFADAGDVSLTNAMISGGYCANSETSMIPAMTSNTTPAGYTVTASSALSGYDAYKAANQTSGAYWDSIAATPPHWWAVSLPSGVAATRYRIKALGALAGNAYPTSWTLQGSNNGTDWTDLDARVSQTPPDDLWWSYNISAPASYSHYRVYFTGTSHADGYLAVDEIELYKADEAMIELNPISLSGAAAGIINFTAQNMDAAAAIDIGNSGSNAVEVIPLIGGVAGSALSFTVEDLGNNLYRFTSAEFDLSGAETFAVRFKTYDRGNAAPNVRIYTMYTLYRKEGA